jgi:hypothetical protein
MFRVELGNGGVNMIYAKFSRDGGKVDSMEITSNGRPINYLHVNCILQKFYKMGSRIKNITFTGFSVDILQVLFDSINLKMYTECITFRDMTGSTETLCHLQDIPVIIINCTMTGCPLPPIEQLHVRMFERSMYMNHIEYADVIIFMAHCRKYGLPMFSRECKNDLRNWVHATARRMYEVLDKVRIRPTVLNDINPEFSETISAMQTICMSIGTDNTREEVENLLEYIDEIATPLELIIPSEGDRFDDDIIHDDIIHDDIIPDVIDTIGYNSQHLPEGVG